MAFHRCVDCLLHRMQEKNLSVEKASLYAELAVTIIGGNALCAAHAEKALNGLIDRNNAQKA